jgi:exosortase
LALFVVGTAAAEVFTQRVGLIGLVASLVVFIGGWSRLRAIGFPIAFLVLAIPLPYVVYYGLTMPMQALAAKIAVGGLKVIGVPAVVQGNIIHLAGGASLEVAEACSGIRSLYAFLAAGALMAHSVRVAWWGRFLVFAMAIPLTIAGNAFRVWGSGVAAWLFGMEATRGTVHEMFGLVVFIVTLGLFYAVKKVALSIWSHGTSQPSSSSPSPESTPPSSDVVFRP